MEHRVHIPKECRPTKTGNKIPIKWDGFEIGSGFVSEDGTTVIFRLDDSPVSREIQAKLTSGLVGGLSINPRITK